MSKNDHTQVTLFLAEPYQENAEIASAFFTKIHYTGFVEENDRLLAYIPVEDFDLDLLTQTIEELASKKIIQPEHTTEIIEDRNWNEVWEQNYFQPIAIKDQLYVRGSFHPKDNKFPNEIIIDPKMSFGTGHHQTTKMILESLMETDIKEKTVIDMGTGTGILAIYAAQQGAKSIVAVDIDDWSVENAQENFELNHCKEKISVYKGDVRILEKLNQRFDVFIANINLGVLLDDVQQYAHYINKDGVLLLSGFLQTDISELIETCPLTYIDKKNEGEWSMLRFKKE
ncbi:MAG: 50S ribosomal protein L11 methyltransferase [Bacteroidia bacterium]|nr:50S ribosomal protein L11 methyltransferase [Bacteroidia bacterium]